MTPLNQTELKQAYEQGATINEIAIQTGQSYGKTRGLLLRAGVEFRAKGKRLAQPTDTDRSTDTTRGE